jgi:hypothetical protein
MRMKRGARLSVSGLTLLIALAGCGRGMWQVGERAPWRHEAEVSCLKSGAVKIGSGVVQIQPIEGPGVCGADFPLKVSALGEGNSPMAYGDDLRPPAGIPNGSSQMPRWPVNEPPRYMPPPQPVAAPSGEQMHWVTGPHGVEQGGTGASAPTYQQQPAYQQRPAYQPSPSYQQSSAPVGAPMSIRPPGEAEPQADDIPDDAIQRPQTAPATTMRVPYDRRPPYGQPEPQSVPPLGPPRAPAAAPTEATLTPPATLACPLVSALDRWVSEGVQPAALHWFHQPVVTIKQISAYSCRDMVGNSTEHISEHAFGNAMDVAAFTLADGRTITVQHGWHGSPEEQGFLHDVQLYACETFTTVLAPGYNAAHYNHIHVDLMRRASGRRPCRPNAVPGEVVAARVRAHYASRGPAYTGSIPQKTPGIGDLIAGQDGEFDDDAADTPAVPAPAKEPKKSGGLLDFSRWSLFGKSSMNGGARTRAAPAY